MSKSKSKVTIIYKPIESLKPHPRNYQGHPEDQLAHIIASIKENDFYRPVVMSQDGFILAGHGLVQAAKKMGYIDVPTIELPLNHDDNRALKVVTGDNEISNGAEKNDMLLVEILKQIYGESHDALALLGTGYTDQQLAALVMVVHPEAKIRDIDEAAEWVGMPEFSVGETKPNITIGFPSAELRAEFVKRNELVIVSKSKDNVSWKSKWPNAENRDVSSVRFEKSDDKTKPESPAETPA